MYLFEMINAVFLRYGMIVMIDKTEKNRLLRLRAKMNKKRPQFKRENYFRLKRIQTSWRRPKGIDSKMRHQLRGKRKNVQTGYRGPKEVRGLHPSGKEIVSIYNPQDLDNVNNETQIGQIGSSVGSRKRINILNKADDLNIHIINPQVRRIEAFDDDLSLEVDDEFELLDEDLDLVDDEDLNLVEDEEMELID